MGHFLHAVELPDLVQGVNAGRQATVETEYGIVYNSCEREVVKQLSEVDPHIGVSVLAETLVVEAIDLSDLSHLVVSSQDSKAILESHFQGDQKSNSFDRVVPTVDIIAHEEVVSIWRLSANFE